MGKMINDEKMMGKMINDEKWYREGLFYGQSKAQSSPCISTVSS